MQPLPPYEQAPVPNGFSPGEVGRDIWYLVDVDGDDQTIHAGVPSVPCSRFSEFTVEVAPEVVTVTAWRETLTSDVFACPQPLGVESVSLRLPEPLAGRDIVGMCRPGESTTDERMCRGLADLLSQSE
jgi:hypothetical protein